MILKGIRTHRRKKTRGEHQTLRNSPKTSRNSLKSPQFHLFYSPLLKKTIKPIPKKQLNKMKKYKKHPKSFSKILKKHNLTKSKKPNLKYSNPMRDKKRQEKRRKRKRRKINTKNYKDLRKTKISLLSPKKIGKMTTKTKKDLNTYRNSHPRTNQSNFSPKPTRTNNSSPNHKNKSAQKSQWPKAYNKKSNPAVHRKKSKRKCQNTTVKKSKSNTHPVHQKETRGQKSQIPRMRKNMFQCRRKKPLGLRRVWR